MFESVKNAFKVKEIRNRIFFTLVMLVIIRFGSQLPVPGVNREYFANWFAQHTGDAFSLVDAFTGGSFLNMSVLALNITSYNRNSEAGRDAEGRGRGPQDAGFDHPLSYSGTCTV